jgi:uncharacterized protein
VTCDAALYFGTVLHHRMRPRSHRLSYRVFWTLLNIDALPGLQSRHRLFSLNRFNLFSFYYRDHGPGDGLPLRPWVETHLRHIGIEIGNGAIHLLCNPRVLGYAFNPLSIYFCHREDGELAATLYEVHNTFGERHCYLLPAAASGGIVRQSCPKRFYVSPFMQMEATYAFRIMPPGEKIAVAVQESDAEGLLLNAVFTGQRRPFSDRELAVAFLRHPLLPLKIIAGIHWEASKLWAKGMRLMPRPPPPANLVSYGATEKI